MTLILVGVSLIGVIYAGAITMTKLFAEFGLNVSLPLACWILGGLAALYVAVGGLKACAWADLLQGSYDALVAGLSVMALDRAATTGELVDCAPLWCELDALYPLEAPKQPVQPAQVKQPKRLQ